MKEVKAKWIIKLPEDGEIEVKIEKNAGVAQGELLAKIRQTEILYIDAGDVMKGWNQEKIDQWKNMYQGKQIKKGEVLASGNGMWTKKITADRDGVVVTIDEFGQIHFTDGQEDVKLVKSPVEAKIYKLEREKIGLSFGAVEVTGEATGKAKTWGDGQLRLLREIATMKAVHRDGIVFVKSIDQVWLSKAEAIGVSGMVVVTNKPIDWEELSFTIPVIKISNETFEKLNERLGSEDKYRMMVNSNSGRLLVVVK